MRTSIFTVTLLATAMAGCVTNANANSHLNCKVYADEVMKSVRHSNALGCDFTNAQWRNDYNFHLNWCNQGTTKIHHLGEQQNIRAAELEQCKAKVQIRDQNTRAKQLECNQYAKDARSLREQLRNSCQSSNAWPVDMKEDFNWCMKNSLGAAKVQNTVRYNELTQCKLDARVKVFNKPGVKYQRIFLPIDVCNKGVPSGAEGLYNFCGQGNADLFCKKRGYAVATAFKKKNFNNGSNMDGDKPTTWWQETNKPCTGACTGFTSITCKGHGAP